MQVRSKNYVQKRTTDVSNPNTFVVHETVISL